MPAFLATICMAMHACPHLPDPNSNRLRKILNLGTTASLTASSPFTPCQLVLNFTLYGRSYIGTLLFGVSSRSVKEADPVDISGTVVGESPDCLLLSGTVVGENPDHVCWVVFTWR